MGGVVKPVMCVVATQGDRLPRGRGGNGPCSGQPDVSRKRHQARGVEGRAVPQSPRSGAERDALQKREPARHSAAGRRGTGAGA